MLSGLPPRQNKKQKLIQVLFNNENLANKVNRNFIPDDIVDKPHSKMRTTKQNASGRPMKIMKEFNSLSPSKQPSPPSTILKNTYATPGN